MIKLNVFNSQTWSIHKLRIALGVAIRNECHRVERRGWQKCYVIFFCIRPPPGLLPVLGPAGMVHDAYT